MMAFSNVTAFYDGVKLISPSELIEKNATTVLSNNNEEDIRKIFSRRPVSMEVNRHMSISFGATKTIAMAVDPLFDYDLDEIQAAMKSASVEIPKDVIEDIDLFDTWLEQFK